MEETEQILCNIDAIHVLAIRAVDKTCYNVRMTVENVQQMLTLANRRPFESFLVEIHGGRRFEVDYPAALNFRDGVAVFIAAGGVPVLFDHESVVGIRGDIAEASA